MEQLTMSNRELDKLKVIQNTIDGRITWPIAAQMLVLSERQIGRLCAQVRKTGNRGVIHGLKGRSSNHRLRETLTEEAVNLVKRYYADFKPTFACEKLVENHKLKLSVSSLRKAMIADGMYHPRKDRAKHRQWRQRRACVGMLVQLDGSEHDWFEGRGPRCALLIFIDDATSRILYAQFITVEDTVNLMRCAWQYLKIHGRPVAFYVDKDSIYKVNRQASIAEELRDEMPHTQFARAMQELDIEMVFAESPQAKGRVERGFKTHQDRLVKELRLAGVSDMEAANKFLAGYVGKHNAKFAVAPESAVDAHRPLLVRHQLKKILCAKTVRTVANDYTVRYKRGYMQILEQQLVRVRPKAEIIVEERLDGSMWLWCKGVYLQYKAIEKRQSANSATAVKLLLSELRPEPKKGHVPPKNHPWRHWKLSKKQQKKNAAQQCSINRCVHDNTATARLTT